MTSPFTCTPTHTNCASATSVVRCQWPVGSARWPRGWGRGRQWRRSPVIANVSIHFQWRHVLAPSAAAAILRQVKAQQHAHYSSRLAGAECTPDYRKDGIFQRHTSFARNPTCGGVKSRTAASVNFSERSRAALIRKNIISCRRLSCDGQSHECSPCRHLGGRVGSTRKDHAKTRLRNMIRTNSLVF